MPAFGKDADELLRALAEAARSAPGLVSQNRGSCLAASGSWRSQAIVGRAEHAGHVDSDRGSEMQCAGVVRDQRAAMNEHTRKARKGKGRGPTLPRTRGALPGGLPTNLSGNSPAGQIHVFIQLHVSEAEMTR